MFVGNPLGSISGDAKDFVGQCDVCGTNGVNNALVVEGFHYLKSLISTL